MDTDGGCEKYLPGMGVQMPRWMNKAEKHSYADICASPPSSDDGFIHFRRHRLPPSNFSTEGNDCYQRQNMIDSPEMIPSTQFQLTGGQRSDYGSAHIVPQDFAASALKKTSKFYKAYTTLQSPTSLTLVKLAEASQCCPGGKLESKSNIAVIQEQVEITKTNHVGSGTGHQREMSKSKAISTLDSATIDEDMMKPTDAIFVTKPTSKPREQEMSGSQGPRHLAPKVNSILTYQLDSTTPSATPTQTPTCSPQVARRTGNPFFTGTVDKTDGGNWLFRSSSPRHDKMDELRNNSYEAKVTENGVSCSSSSTTASSQKMRLVPRPSELRELNFWSPTSM